MFRGVVGPAAIFDQPGGLLGSGFVEALVQYHRLHEVNEIGGLHVDRFTVTARRKGKFRLFGQGFRALHGHSEQVAKGGHGAYLAIREAVLEFLFVSEVKKVGVEDAG